MALFGQKMPTEAERRARVLDDGLDRLGVSREALAETVAMDSRRESEAEALFEEHGLGDLLRRDQPVES